MPKRTRTSNHLEFKTRQQIADEYGIDIKTLQRKLLQYGISLPVGLIDFKWQKKIYEALGYPSSVSEEAYKNIR